MLANLANFAYDPSNYEYLRQLQVLDLLLDMLTEDNETLVEFAMGKGCPEHPRLSPGQGTPGPALGSVVNPPQIHAGLQKQSHTVLIKLPLVQNGTEVGGGHDPPCPRRA